MQGISNKLGIAKQSPIKHGEKQKWKNKPRIKAQKVLVVFTKLIERLEMKRYFDSDELTQDQQKLLESDPRVCAVEYPCGFITYTLVGLSYK